MATTSPWYSLIWCAVVALMTMASFLQSSKRTNCLTIFRGSIFLFFPEIYKTHQETFPVKFTIYKNFYLSRNKFLPKILFLKAIYIDIYGMHALPLPLPYQNGRGGGSGEERVKTLEKYLRGWRWGLVGWVKLPGLGKGGRGEGVKKKLGLCGFQFWVIFLGDQPPHFLKFFPWHSREQLKCLSQIKLRPVQNVFNWKKERTEERLRKSHVQRCHF